MAEGDGLETPAIEIPPADPGPPPDLAVEGDHTVESWLDHASPEYRENTALTRYNSLDEFIRGNLEREKLIGQRPEGLQAPNADASVEDWQAFYKSIPGVPDLPAKYTVEPPQVPEGMPATFTGEGFEHFLAMAHASGLADFQVNNIVRHMEQREAEAWQAQQHQDTQDTKEAQVAIDAMWGPLADRNLQVGLEAARREFGGDLGWLEGMTTTDAEGTERLIGNSPQFAKVMYEWGVSRGHDEFVPGGTGMPATVQQAQNQLAQARQEYGKGAMSSDEYSRLEAQLAPIANGVPREGEDLIVGGAMTGIDLA